ncbi:hypothetical protein F4775DRAFT_581771 [Biscogniauxia sp. FL1348]|nr:hypothetical protein F4775DRAFT_581771 [Biscogniauxia sp. FL1348]
MPEQRNPVARKRRRPAKSCEPCRSRKVKCDRGLPCSSCKRSRTALLCSYKPGLRLSPAVSLHPTARTHDDAAVDDCIGISEHHGPTEGIVTTTAQSPVSSPKEVGEHINPETELSHGVHSLEKPCIPNTEHSSHIYFARGEIKGLEARIIRIEKQLSASTQDESTFNKAGLYIKLPHPHLRIEHEKTRLFGPSHWVHSLDQFQTVAKMQVKPYSIVDATQAEAAASLKEVAAVRHLAKSRGAGKLQEPMPHLIDTLPAKSICDQAIECYLRTFEPIFRILHVPSFKRDYEQYWLHSEVPKTSLLMKLIMVLAIGAIFLPDKSISNQIRGVSREWAYAVQWWLIGPTERDAMNLDGVQIFCLLLLARQATSLGGTSSIITEALLKLCFTIGLHHDPQIFSSLSVFESEMRRRLWATSLELITITSMNSSLPLLINVDDFDLRPPSDISDDNLEDGEPAASTTAYSSQESHNCSVQILLLKSIHLRIQAIRQLNSINRDYSYKSVLETGKALMAHCREIAAFFDSSASETNEGITLAEFQMIFLDTYMRRIILFLHRPFAVKARKDPQFFLARKICLESSIIMASYAERIDLSSDSLDDFSRLCIRGSGMFKGALSQDVISALSLEVITQLEEERDTGYTSHISPKTIDPLTTLRRANREPLLRTLSHIREQWRQILLLGRPSLKQYLFLSVILSQIKAIELGQNPKLLVYETFNTELKECATLLRESGACDDKSETAEGWVHDNSPYGTDPFAIFGFDLNSLDPTLTFTTTEWLEPLNIGEPNTLR